MSDGAARRPGREESEMAMDRGLRHRGPGVWRAVVWVLIGAGLSATTASAQSPAGSAVSLTLEEALLLGLERNRELIDARLELENADQQVREAWGNVYPTLELTTSYTRSLTVPGVFLPRIFVDPNADPDELIAVKFGAENNWALNIRAEQPLFRAAAFIGVGAAGRYRMYQEEVVRGRAQAVATRIRLAYYDVLLAEESARLSENAVARVRQALEETRAQQRAGVGSTYDVLRLEVELANLETAVRRAQNAVVAAKRQLAIEVGLDPDEPIAVSGSLAALDLGEEAENDEANRELLRFVGFVDPGEDESAREDVVRDALIRRSELRQLELLEGLREAELKAEWSGFLPTVSLFGTYQINAQQSGTPDFFGSSAAERAYGRQVGVQVTLPIFSGFQRPARVEQRRVAVRRVRTQQDLAAQQVEAQVRTLLDQVDEARERAEAQRFAVEQAQRGHDIASVQFREGIGSRLELTDAELALRQSEFNYAEAVYDYLVARARLDEAVGSVPVRGVGGRLTLDGTGIEP